MDTKLVTIDNQHKITGDLYVGSISSVAGTVSGSLHVVSTDVVIPEATSTAVTGNVCAPCVVGTALSGEYVPTRLVVTDSTNISVSAIGMGSRCLCVDIGDSSSGKGGAICSGGQSAKISRVASAGAWNLIDGPKAFNPAIRGDPEVISPPSDLSSGSYFGTAIALSGDGKWAAASTASSVANVYTFHRPDPTETEDFPAWVQTQVINGTTGINFGSAMAFNYNGAVLAVAAKGGNEVGSGLIMLYKKTSATDTKYSAEIKAVPSDSTAALFHIGKRVHLNLAGNKLFATNQSGNGYTMVYTVWSIDWTTLSATQTQQINDSTAAYTIGTSMPFDIDCVLSCRTKGDYKISFDFIVFNIETGNNVITLSIPTGDTHQKSCCNMSADGHYACLNVNANVMIYSDLVDSGIWSLVFGPYNMGDDNPSPLYCIIDRAGENVLANYGGVPIVISRNGQRPDSWTVHRYMAVTFPTGSDTIDNIVATPDMSVQLMCSASADSNNGKLYCMHR